MPAVGEMYIFLCKNGINCGSLGWLGVTVRRPIEKIKNLLQPAARGGDSLGQNEGEVARPNANLPLLGNRLSVCVVDMATRITSKWICFCISKP